MRCRKALPLALILTISVLACAQTVQPASEQRVPILGFKLLMRSTQPSFSPGEALKLEVACVSIPEIASTEWQERWSNACLKVELGIEEARIGSHLGGVGTMAWLWNKLYQCLPPPGESYEQENQLAYTQPKWHPIILPTKTLSGLRGMVRIDAHATLKDGQRMLYDEHAQVVTAIVSAIGDGTEAERSSEIQDASTGQLGDSGKIDKLANELLDSPTKSALELAVRLFDNTEQTGSLWTVIESSPYQESAIDLMLMRLKNPDLIPSYQLLLNLTGMKARLDKPLEFAASDRQPYPEYHPDLEDMSVASFRSLLTSLVDSTDAGQSARAKAITNIATSLAQGDRCPSGTYGVSSIEAAAIRSKLSVE